MESILTFCANYFYIFLILALIFGFGISGFYIDKNTNVLEVEKQKKALLERKMDIELVKSQFKDKNMSLGGTMGVKSGNDDNIVSNNIPSAIPDNSGLTVVNEPAAEDLSVPLNLNN